MPAASFGYTPVDIPPSTAFPQGQRVLRPWLAAHVTVASGQAVSCMVCLDTGADCCTFPLRFASRLGLDPAAMPADVYCGATGSGDIYYADVGISIPFDLDGRRYELTANTRAGFTAGMDAQGMGLLGQVGFFDRYPVTFDQPQGIFTVRF